MDPTQHQQAREHFFRLQDMPAEDRRSELESLEAEEPEIGAYVRSLIEADAESASDDDLFERAIHGGVAEQARSMAKPFEYQPGQEIGEFTIVDLLGHGGFGDVYLAEQASPSRRVALKVVKAGMDSARVISRFEDEKQLLASLEHPHIARLYAAGRTPMELGSRPYFAMEHVNNAPITEYSDNEGLGLKQRLRLFLPVCDAVQHAHNRLIVHRDLKPSNILISGQGKDATPKIIDFGIAKALNPNEADATRNTLEGQLIGTLAYMSPEQAGGGTVGTATDVYALGMVLYQLCTGTLPFSPKTLGGVPPSEAQRIIQNEDPPKPSTRMVRPEEVRDRKHGAPLIEARQLRGGIDDIILKCLRKDPDQRYKSCTELADDLNRYLSGEPIRARPPSAFYKYSTLARKHWKSVTAASFIVVSVISAIVALGALLYQSKREAGTRIERDRYQEQYDLAELANAGLEAAKSELEDTNAELESAKSELELTNGQLESANSQLRQQSSELRAAVDETTRLAEQERRAKDAAEAARRELALANADLEQAHDDLAASLDETQEARDRAVDALALAQANAERAAEEAERADAEAANFKDLYAQSEQSIRVLTQGNRIPTDVLARIAAALDSAKLLQAQILQRLSQRAVADADLPEAIELQRQALSAFTGALGSDHDITLRSRLDLIGLFQRSGRTTEAEQQLGLMNTAAARSLDPADPLFTEVELARASNLLSQGRLDDALALMDSVVADLEAKYGTHELRTLKALRRRAMVHAALGNNAQAEADYRRVLTLNSSASDEGREELTIAANNLAVLLRESQRDAEAEAIMARAVQTANGVWGPANWRTAIVQAQHASVLAAIGSFDPAERKLLDAYDVLASTLGRQHTETRAVARELLFMYEAWDAADGTNRHASDARRWQGVLNVPR